MKDISGFEGKYAVTTDGRVWSYKHKKFLKPKICRGYCHVDLVDKNNKVKQCLVHRLVAQTYLPNPDNLPQVNHKDECPTNNSVDNLEWCTASYNLKYGSRSAKAMQHESMKNKVHIMAAARMKKVVCIETGVIYDSIKAAGAAVGVSAQNIGKCCKGKRDTCGGYHWHYANAGGGAL